jgi:predicted transcriptional regulator
MALIQELWHSFEFEFDEEKAKEPYENKEISIFSLIERISQYRSLPGTCISEIASDMSLSRGTLSYHLNILEAKNLIEVHSDCGKIRYFQNNSIYCEKEKLV